MAGGIDLSKALIMIISLAIIFATLLLWAVWGRWRDLKDHDEDEDDEAVAHISSLPIDYDGKAIGEPAYEALAKRDDAIFFGPGKAWDALCAEHPIMNIVFVHDAMPRFTRVCCFGFEVLTMLWGFCLENQFSYPEASPACESYVSERYVDWKDAKKACETQQTVMGFKLCYWDRCADKCSENEPPEDVNSPEHFIMVARPASEVSLISRRRRRPFGLILAAFGCGRRPRSERWRSDQERT